MTNHLWSLKRLREEEEIPRGYGIVRYDFPYRGVIIAPIPLNLLLQIFYIVYGSIQYGLFKSMWETKLARATDDAVRDGW